MFPSLRCTRLDPECSLRVIYMTNESIIQGNRRLVKLFFNKTREISKFARPRLCRGRVCLSINPPVCAVLPHYRGELEGAKPASNRIKCRAKPCYARRAWSEASIFVPRSGTKITALFQAVEKSRRLFRQPEAPGLSRGLFFPIFKWLRHGCSAPRSCRPVHRGREMMNRVTPPLLSQRRVPRWASIIALAMGSPRPKLSPSVRASSAR